ncbi:hypothetical protein NDU88_002273 [Pleurodeles waltl]|uniref:Uncharacterized protein n=1 Tax=Pleurodeles waltl TaxID=8319 RepID=A0AAV7M027_PLEWA|nr:hypothetical protein NDU88_002273 [Pleurodeles waltl]
MTGNLVRDCQQIAGTFEAYFAQIYTATIKITLGQTREFLTDVKLQSLSEENQQFLNKEISEVCKASEMMTIQHRNLEGPTQIFDWYSGSREGHREAVQLIQDGQMM